MKYRLLEDRFEHTANTIVYDPAGWREIMNRAIDDLIESARLFGGTQAKRGFGVYTQDDAIMEHSFWEGVEARAKAIRDEVAALKAERDAVMKDAERYRWLRKQHWSKDDIAVVVNPKKQTRLGAICPSLGLLDDTIDHMRKETP